MKPRFVAREDVPADLLADERRIAEETARQEGKPEQALPRIVEGRLNKFYEQAVLLDQPFVKDPTKTVGELVTDKVAKTGEKITIRRFTRYKNDPADSHSLGSDYVWRILESRSGELWIGTDGGGLNLFDRSTRRFARYLNNPGDPGSLSRDIVLSPRSKSVALDRPQLDVPRRIIAPVAALHRERTQRAQRPQPVAGGVRRLGVEPLRFRPR